MGHALVVYYSQSGNTQKMAELVAEGVRRSGNDATVVDVKDLKMMDFLVADGYALGSPDYFTYIAGRVKILFEEALAHRERIKGRPYVGFVSHGGGGGALESMDNLAKHVGLKKVATGVKSLGAPSAETAEECRKLGEQLGKEL